MTRRREFPQRAWRSVKNQPGARQKSEESRRVLLAKGDDIMVAARGDVVGTGRLWRDLPGRFWAVGFGRHARSAGCARGRCFRRLAGVPQGAGGKRRPTDGSPITLHQGRSIPPADRRTRPSDAPKNGSTARPTEQMRPGPTARIVRQISVRETCDMSPRFASAADVALWRVAGLERPKGGWGSGPTKCRVG